MPEVPAIYMGPAIQPAVSGTIAGIMAGAVTGYYHEEAGSGSATPGAWKRHVRTQTYDDNGRLVESPAPPTVNIRT